MVVVAVMALVMAVAAPSLSGLLDLQQEQAAKEIAQTYTWLIDEARLRNVSFRIAYNLDENTWKVQVGGADATTFATPEDRQKAEQELRDEMRRYTERELDEEGKRAEIEKSVGMNQFKGLDESDFKTARKLPDGVRFAWVYTPAYGDRGLHPSEKPPDSPEDEHIAYTYVFPDGSAEHAIVRLVDADAPDDSEDGWTIEVQPINGEVRLTRDIVNPTDAMRWLSDDAPTIQ